MIWINRFHHRASEVPYLPPSAHYRGSFSSIRELLRFITEAASVRYETSFGSLGGSTAISSKLVSRGSDLDDDLFRTGSKRVCVGSGQWYQTAPDRPQFSRSSFCALGFWQSGAEGTNWEG